MVSPPFRAAIAPLFVPGDRPERFFKAVASGADAVILDMEDAVGPEAKDIARGYVSKHNLSGIMVIVRVNSPQSPWFDADLEALKNAPLSAVMLPKAETADDIEAVHRRLNRIVPVVPLVETARGIAQLTDILSAEGVVQAALGSVDLAVDLACAHTWEALLLARSEIVLRSRLAACAAPLDGVTTALDDAMLVEAEARRGADMGFGGKLAIHPKQITPICRAFMPDQKTQAWAHKIVRAAADGAVARVDGEMIDRPVIEQAKRILTLIERLQLPRE